MMTHEIINRFWPISDAAKLRSRSERHLPATFSRQRLYNPGKGEDRIHRPGTNFIKPIYL